MEFLVEPLIKQRMSNSGQHSTGGGKGKIIFIVVVVMLVLVGLYFLISYLSSKGSKGGGGGGGGGGLGGLLGAPATGPGSDIVAFDSPVYNWHTNPIDFDCTQAQNLGGDNWATTRDVFCVDENNNNTTVDDSKCGASKPQSSQNCDSPYTYDWVYSDYGPCGGIGVQTRTVTCQQTTHKTGAITTVPDQECTDAGKTYSAADLEKSCELTIQACHYNNTGEDYDCASCDQDPIPTPSPCDVSGFSCSGSNCVRNCQSYATFISSEANKNLDDIFTCATCTDSTDSTNSNPCPDGYTCRKDLVPPQCQKQGITDVGLVFENAVCFSAPEGSSTDFGDLNAQQQHQGATSNTSSVPPIQWACKCNSPVYQPDNGCSPIIQHAMVNTFNDLTTKEPLSSFEASDLSNNPDYFTREKPSADNTDPPASGDYKDLLGSVFNTDYIVPCKNLPQWSSYNSPDNPISQDTLNILNYGLTNPNYKVTAANFNDQLCLVDNVLTQDHNYSIVDPSKISNNSDTICSPCKKYSDTSDAYCTANNCGPGHCDTDGTCNCNDPYSDAYGPNCEKPNPCGNGGTIVYQSNNTSWNTCDCSKTAYYLGNTSENPTCNQLNSTYCNDGFASFDATDIYHNGPPSCDCSQTVTGGDQTHPPNVTASLDNSSDKLPPNPLRYVPKDVFGKGPCTSDNDCTGAGGTSVSVPGGGLSWTGVDFDMKCDTTSKTCVCNIGTWSDTDGGCGTSNSKSYGTQCESAATGDNGHCEHGYANWDDTDKTHQEQPTCWCDTGNEANKYYGERCDVPISPTICDADGLIEGTATIAPGVPYPEVMYNSDRQTIKYCNCKATRGGKSCDLTTSACNKKGIPGTNGVQGSPECICNKSIFTPAPGEESRVTWSGPETNNDCSYIGCGTKSGPKEWENDNCISGGNNDVCCFQNVGAGGVAAGHNPCPDRGDGTQMVSTGWAEQPFFVGAQYVLCSPVLEEKGMYPADLPGNLYSSA